MARTHEGAAIALKQTSAYLHPTSTSSVDSASQVLAMLVAIPLSASASGWQYKIQGSRGGGAPFRLVRASSHPRGSSAIRAPSWRKQQSNGAQGRSRDVVTRAITRPGVADDSSVDYSGPKATLDGNTIWRLQLALEEGVPPAVLKVRFLRDEGYEPPQGVIEVVEDEAGLAVEGAKTRWELGEDPDKKSENPMDGGGLWIWALFSETPFPCMLFKLQLEEYGQVYIKATHGQGLKRGTVLTEGVMSTRTVTEVAADLIGLSKAQISEAQPAGTVRINPVGCY